MAFGYTELDRQHTEFRLLKLLRSGSHPDRLQCHIFKAYINHPPPYKALSYTWGSANNPSYAIELDGRPFIVRENLWSALNKLRQADRDENIWIDAICINQEDVLERNHQVRHMRSIYQCAEQVIIWLGPSEVDSDVALSFARQLYYHRDETQWIADRLEQPDASRCLKALADLFVRPYWDRVWIIQEIILAKSTIVYCDDAVIDGAALSEVQDLIINVKDAGTGMRTFYRLLPDDSESRQRIQWCGPASMLATRQAVVSKSLGLYELLEQHMYKNATEKKDMIYGFVGLTSWIDDPTFEIDYAASQADIYTDVVRREILQSGKLDIITKVRGQLPLQGYPSWVPDWSLRIPGHTFLQDPRQPQFHYHASGLSAADVSFTDKGNVMKLNTVVLGSVCKVSRPSRMKSYDDLDNAVKAIHDWRELVLDEDVLADSAASMPRQESLVRTLRAHRFTPDQYQSLTGGLSVAEFQRALSGYFGERWVALQAPDESAKVDNLMSECMAFRNAKLPKSDKVEHFLASWIQNGAAPYIWDRRLFIIDDESHSLGLGPEHTIEGDIVCIPYGCSSPVILRPSHGCHHLVGEAYVDGVMDGEAVSRVRHGGLETRHFILH